MTHRKHSFSIHFAPIQGITDAAYCRLHSQLYEGANVYYTPFMRVEKGAPRRQDLRRLHEASGDGPEIVPQIIFRSVEEFKILAEAVKNAGFRHIDLNLGCPYPMQTKKGRGCAMITNVEVMRQIADLINDDERATYSVKTRLGLSDTDEWRILLNVLNDTRLTHITLHPRTGTQMYTRAIAHDAAKDFINMSSNAVVWNGEIHTADDIDQLGAEHPQIAGVMIGRGLLARPSLIAEWRSGVEWSRQERINRLLQFHEELLRHRSATLCGDTQILQHMKPFWEYLEGEIGHKTHKAIMRAKSMRTYTAAVAEIARD